MSIYLTIYLFMSIYVSIYVYLSVHLYMCLCIFRIHLSVSLLFINFSFYQSSFFLHSLKFLRNAVDSLVDFDQTIVLILLKRALSALKICHGIRKEKKKKKRKKSLYECSLSPFLFIRWILWHHPHSPVEPIRELLHWRVSPGDQSEASDHLRVINCFPYSSQSGERVTMTSQLASRKPANQRGSPPWRHRQ